MKKTYHLVIMLLAFVVATITTSCSREESVTPSVSKKSKLTSFDYSSLPSMDTIANNLLNSDYIEINGLPTGINGTGGTPYCDKVRYYKYQGSDLQSNEYVIVSGYDESNKGNAEAAIGGCDHKLTTYSSWVNGKRVQKVGCGGSGNECKWVPQTDDKGTTTPLDDSVYWLVVKC